MRRLHFVGLLFLGAVVLAYAFFQGGPADGTPPKGIATTWQRHATAVLQSASGAGSAVREDGTLSFDGAPRGVAVDLGAGTVAAVARILPFGDSITAGTVTLELRDTGGYREHMWQMAVEAGGIVEFVGPERSAITGPADPDHAGFPRRTIRWALDHASAIVAGHAPDAVLLMMGTNDTNDISVRDTLVEAGTLMSRMGEAAPGALLLVADPPPMRADAQPDWRQRRLRLLTMGLPIVVRAQSFAVPGLVHVPTPLTVDDISPPPADNGLHPTVQGYCRMARAWTAALARFGITAGLLGDRGTLPAGITGVIGTAHNDRLVAGPGPTKLLGGDGNDVLVSGGGGDQLWGGDGADLFVLTAADLDSAEPAVIHDFDSADGDRLDLAGLEAALPPGAVLRFDRAPAGTSLVLHRSGQPPRTIAELPRVRVGADAVHRPAFGTDCQPVDQALYTAKLL